MRVVIQRVKKASVTVDNEIIASIDHGLLLFLGIEVEDSPSDIDWLIAKIINLRIFEDLTGAMNHSLIDRQGELLIVSQFTLHASIKKGNRPSFIKAAKPDVAIPLYDLFVSQLEKKMIKKPKTGKFGSMMDVMLINDGPVTILIDSKNKE